MRHKLPGDFNRLVVSCLECFSLDPNTGFIFLCYPMFPPSSGLSFLGSPPLSTLSSVWPFLPREKCCLSISFRVPPDREAQSLVPALCVSGGDCTTAIIFSPLLFFFQTRILLFRDSPWVHLIPSLYLCVILLLLRFPLPWPLLSAVHLIMAIHTRTTYVRFLFL